MIESALQTHLQSKSEILSPYLARYSGLMAIFNQEAPSDTDKGWETQSQYGRIVYAVDLTDDPERHISGTLMVDVQCEDGKQLPEEMEPIIRELIDGYFFSTPDTTIAAWWSASNYFTEPTEKILGVTLSFGLLAFPKQTTIEPDPIRLINKWTKEELAQDFGMEFRVIGYDALEPAWKPTSQNPAIYWRLSATNPCGWIPDTYNTSWRTATVNGHILCPDKELSGIIARYITNILSLKRRLIFEDVSPLMVDRNIRVNLSTDEFRVGQIILDATYGLLRAPIPSSPINNTNIEERRTSNE